ncbi:MAG: hypothetical protein GYA50_10415 [Eubacteriaceae bacterium]|nr:hypothetical protein [Eubacteriaceae bacterium]
MCYYLYGNIDVTAYNEDFFKVCDKFNIPHNKLYDYDIELKSKIKPKGVFFRLTDNHCDCNSSIGSEKINNKELTNYLNWLTALKKYRDINYVYIFKRWSDDIIDTKITIHFDNIDNRYLADMKENTFYRIQLL